MQGAEPGGSKMLVEVEVIEVTLDMVTKRVSTITRGGYEFQDDEPHHSGIFRNELFQKWLQVSIYNQNLYIFLICN